MYKKISDYGIIGNLHSVALVGLDGSIDWLCLPHIDSPSVFCALLDDKKGGRFSITPLDEWDSVARYIPETNVLTTLFRTRRGEMKLTDFMPIPLSNKETLKEERHELYRLVEITKGNVEVGLFFDPRFNYARTHTTLEKQGEVVIARGKNEHIVLSSTHDIKVLEDKAIAEWGLGEGDKVWLLLDYMPKEPFRLDPEKAEKSLQETLAYWRNWLHKSETGRPLDLAAYQHMVNRSALTLKLLYYDPTGTIAAAATTSLPEEIGGVRNWDYRFTWVRDTSFTLQALFNLGHLSEMEGFLRWMERSISRCGAEELQIVYGLHGEEDIPEEELSHLDGYKGSKPVRIGNKAAKQQQLDIYGELMDAALKLSDYVGKIDINMWPSLCDICDYVAEHWRDKDHGIWEVRGGPYHFVYSKVMCWVALDRAITIAKRYGFPGDLKKWDETKAKIREEVLKRGWNEKKKAFVQHYDTDALDSSNFLIPYVGFLPYDDPRVISTVEAIRLELGHNGFLYRYASHDGLPGKEGTFLLCTFWLIDNLIALGRLGEAEKLLHQVETTANHLGLFPEEYDFNWDEALGNFPQAFTHIGYINNVVALCSAKSKMAGEQKKARNGLFFSTIITLNDGEPLQDIASKEIAPRLKHSMNILRGAFFDTRGGRVAYERISGSRAYHEYVELSYNLKRMDLHFLTSRTERIAFWVNLYNVLVIHGVIALAIKDSVKEVKRFFKRIRYQIDDMFFTPHDIEHGILRNNQRPPLSLFKVFKGKDKRLNFVIEPMDPRIHFGLVCASSSCPPIEVYTAGNLDEQLTIAGKVFINSGGVIIDRKRRRVFLSQVFNWYRRDFGKTQAERLRFIVPYLYDEKDREFLGENAETIKVDYQDYDWRLNRY